MPSLDKIIEWEFPALMAFIKASEEFFIDAPEEFFIDKSDTNLGHDTSTSGIPPRPSWPFC